MNDIYAIDHSRRDGRANCALTEYARHWKQRLVKGGNLPLIIKEMHDQNKPVAFTQKQRNEVRCLGETAGSLMAEPGMKQQTYVCEPVYSLEGNGQRASNRGDGWHGEDAMYTPNATEQHGVVYDITGASSNSMMSDNPSNCFRQMDVSRTLDGFVASPDCNQGGEVVVSKAIDCRNLRTTEEISRTIQSKGNGGYSLNYINPVFVEEADSERMSPVSIGNGQLHNISMPGVSNPLDCMHDQQAIIKPGRHRRYIVRRLTPTECARLQGFPDWWCDDVDGSDSAQYKMWGNGMTLPVVWRVMAGIRQAYLDDLLK